MLRRSPCVYIHICLHIPNDDTSLAQGSTCSHYRVAGKKHLFSQSMPAIFSRTSAFQSFIWAMHSPKQS